MTRLPAAAHFAKLSVIDQLRNLDYQLREIEDEIEGLESGYIRTERRSRAHYLQLARARMRRLRKLARDFGHGEAG